VDAVDLGPAGGKPPMKLDEGGRDLRRGWLDCSTWSYRWLLCMVEASILRRRA
jgi:hypothetical protein